MKGRKKMTAYTWTGGTGDWDIGSNWSPSGGPPTATDSATINETGAAYTVTVDTADVAKSLTENSASATVEDTGSLTLSKTFALEAGAFLLDGGELSGGTVKLEGGTFDFSSNNGTLSRVTFDGTLDLSAEETYVSLANGTTVNDAAGTGPGTIDDNGYGTIVYFDNTQTFNNATINLGSTVGNYGILEQDDVAGTGAVLTLGSNIAIDEIGYAQINAGLDTGDSIVSRGVINQSVNDSVLGITGNSFTNDGTITANSDDSTLSLESSTVINNGTIAVSNEDTVNIDGGSAGSNARFSNSGSITVAADSTLFLQAITQSGSSTGSSIDNAGLLQADGAVTVTSPVTNTGAIEILPGSALDFKGAVTGTGTATMEDEATLEFDASVATRKTAGSQQIDFTGGGSDEVLNLTDPTTFWGGIDGFGTGDTIDLAGDWTFSGITHPTPGDTLLRLESGSIKHNFEFVGDYTRGDLDIASGATTTTITTRT
jgi:hypothetical protein